MPQEPLEQSLKYRQWVELLKTNNIQIQAIEPLHLIHKPNGELLFGLVHIQAQDPEGQKLLPIALLRGHFVSVVTVLQDEQTHEEFLLLVGQRRVAHGEISYEHPAGMSDSQTDPFEVAMKEVHEETGLKVTKEQLILVTPKPLYTSAGLLDEGGYFFYCKLRLPGIEIEAFKDKQTGAMGENEFIKTKVVPIHQAMSMMNSTTSRLNLYMYLEAMNK